MLTIDIFYCPSIMQNDGNLFTALQIVLHLQRENRIDKEVSWADMRGEKKRELRVRSLEEISAKHISEHTVWNAIGRTFWKS